VRQFWWWDPHLGLPPSLPFHEPPTVRLGLSDIVVLEL
jgi:hypothetical protein